MTNYKYDLWLCRGCKWNILWTYIRNAKIVLYGPYCVHIWHLYVPCRFAENFPVIRSRNYIVCITHLIITWRNKWVCKIGKSPDKLWFLICCIWRTCKNQFWKFNKNCGWYLLCFCHALYYAWRSKGWESHCPQCLSSFLEALLNSLLINW